MSADSRGKAKADREAGHLAPGAHLRAEIQRLGLDQVAVSKATGVSRQSINNIINGRQTISRAMAGKLGRLTGQSSDYWLRDSFPKKASAHLAASVPTRTAGAGVLVNHQIARAVKDGIIGIEPFTAKNLRTASIDLTLSGAITAAGGKRIDINRGKGFLLEPGRAVNASTQERIELPLDYIGRVGAAGRLASHGIIASHAFHIGPGFKGRVDFCLFNASAKAFRLRHLDPVLSLEIARLGVTPDEGRAG